MIDPFAITDYGRDDESLEEVLLFWVCAAGKDGALTARLLERFLRHVDPKRRLSPFEAIRSVPAECLPGLLKDLGFGCYNHRARAMRELSSSGIDLRSCSADELESVHGIGLKTARCFLLHSRRVARVAGLDVHVKEYLRSLGHEVPSSLTRKQYLRYEQVFLSLADERGIDPAALDLQVWSSSARGRKKD